MSLHRQEAETPDSIYPTTMRSQCVPKQKLTWNWIIQRKLQRRAWGSVRGTNREHGLREGGKRTTRNRKRTLFGIYFFPTSIPTLLYPNPTCLLRTALRAQLQHTPLIASFPSASFGYALPPGSIRISIFPETLEQTSTYFGLLFPHFSFLFRSL